jgi:hypothetical protein
MPIKNKKREKLVEKEILAWAFMNKIVLEVYDSKGTYSAKLGRYTENTGLDIGTPDLQGFDENGFFLRVELKDKGKDHICSLDQYRKLERAIQSNCFGAVVSSESQLETLYKMWLSLRSKSLESSRKYLLDNLPKKVMVNKKILTLG